MTPDEFLILLKTKLTIPTSSKTKLANDLSEIYINFIETLPDKHTGKTRNVGLISKNLLRLKIQKICNSNTTSRSKVDFLEQIGPTFQNFWRNVIFVDIKGITTITNPGIWVKRDVKENLNPTIFIENFHKNCIEQLSTMKGKFVNNKLQETAFENFLTK